MIWTGLVGITASLTLLFQAPHTLQLHAHSADPVMMAHREFAHKDAQETTQEATQDAKRWIGSSTEQITYITELR